MNKILFWVGWKLMGIPWWSDRALEHSFEKDNWHAKLYWAGARLANWRQR